jgi:XTP/dITP diphosphohydrolase
MSRILIHFDGIFQVKEQTILHAHLISGIKTAMDGRPERESSTYRENATMKTLLIATTNPGKIKEFCELLADLPIEIVTPNEINLTLAVNETGHTYQENASLKARAYADQSGLVAIADDSGLEVEALQGAPGIYSARYTNTPGATDADRRRFLLEQLRGCARPWTARFFCLVAVAEPNGPLHFAEGACPGEIIPEERGDRGFGCCTHSKAGAGTAGWQLNFHSK